MTIKTLKLLSPYFIAAAGLAAFCGLGQCEELAPYAGKTIEIDGMRGTVYYVTKGEDYVVVATLDSNGSPLRFVTTLQPGQSTKISTPGGVDQPEKAIEFRRDGDRLSVIDRTLPERLVSERE
jgi:hypothetical protein